MLERLSHDVVVACQLDFHRRQAEQADRIGGRQRIHQSRGRVDHQPASAGADALLIDDKDNRSSAGACRVRGVRRRCIGSGRGVDVIGAVKLRVDDLPGVTVDRRGEVRGLQIANGPTGGVEHKRLGREDVDAAAKHRRRLLRRERHPHSDACERCKSFHVLDPGLTIGLPAAQKGHCSSEYVSTLSVASA